MPNPGKTGRKPARFTRASFLRSHILGRHLADLGPPPAASPDWVKAVMDQSPDGWGTEGNVDYGDCVFADCAHAVMLRTANIGQIVIPTTKQTLQLYTDVTGFDPNDPSTDQGAIELQVINYLIATGWLGRKLVASANLDPTMIEHIKWSVNLFGDSRLGVNLPDSAMDQFSVGKPWDAVPGAQIAGGHDVPVVKYDADGTIWIVTWGQLWPVTPAFMAGRYADGMPYVEEAHCELAFDWVNALDTSPSGFSLKDLAEELASVV